MKVCLFLLAAFLLLGAGCISPMPAEGHEHRASAPVVEAAPASRQPASRQPRVEIATTGRTRAMMLFVRFRDDRTTNACALGLQEWPYEAPLPRLADYVLAAEPTPPFPDSSLTEFFYRQSHGVFTLYGDVFGYVTARDETAYRRGQTNRIDLGMLTRELVDHFSRRIDFSQYDENGDGFVDHIFVIIRNFNHLILYQNPHVGGVASLGADFTREDDVRALGGVRIAANRSGSVNRYQVVDVTRDNVLLLAHEFGHHLFNANGYFPSHLNPIHGNRVPFHPPPDRDHDFADRMVSYSLMQGEGTASVAGWRLHLSAAERSYINADNPDPATHWIDCPTPQHGQTVALRDLYTTGDCVRLQFESDPQVTELFLQHIDDSAFINAPRFNRSGIDVACPGCRLVEGGTPVTGLLVELSRRNAEKPFRAVRDVLPADNALHRHSGCDLAVDIGRRVAETFADDFWRPNNRRQLTPWTRPNVYGYTFGADVPAHYHQSGWHVFDDLRYSGSGRSAIAFDYYRTPFELDTFVVRADSWMDAASDGIAFAGHVRVDPGARLAIEDGITVRFDGGLTVEEGATVVVEPSGATLLFGDGALLRVEGTLEADSAILRPVAASWRGISRGPRAAVRLQGTNVVGTRP
jgi:hypothetical protein